MRQSLRAFTRAALVDPEWPDQECVPRLKTVHKSFHDKLGPARRWLRSHVGEPWDDVYSQLVRKFDTRTVPGRHIVFDHMLRDVRRGYRVKVDERGILREAEPFRCSRASEVASYEEAQLASAFTGSSRIAARGAAFFWCEPTYAGTEPTGRYRQAARLTAAEGARWASLSPETRKRFASP